MRLLVTALALACAIMVSSCGLFSRSPEIRYRLTVIVNTPEGARSADGVWSMQLRPGGIDQGYRARFRGEAIPLTLPGGRMIVALLDFRGTDNQPIQGIAPMIPERAFPPRYLPRGRYPASVGYSRPSQIEYLKKHYRDRIKLDCTPGRVASECPLLVAFRKSSDPTSVFALDPDDLSKDFGPGYSLEGIYLQITDDPPSHQLGRQFAWLDGDWDRYLGPLSTAPPESLAYKLVLFSFRKWGT